MSDFSFASGDSLLERFTILRQCYQWKGTEIYRVMDSQNDCEAYLVLTNPDTRPLFLEGRADAVGLFPERENFELFRAEIQGQAYWVQVTPNTSIFPYDCSTLHLEDKAGEHVYSIFSSLLEQLKELHERIYPFCLNNIHPYNVWIERAEVVGWRAEFISFADISSYSTQEEPWRPSCSNWFKANEVFQGVCDARTDVFSMGCLLYFFLLKKYPWKEEEDSEDCDPFRICNLHRHEPDWGILHDDVFRGVLAFLRKAMNPNPQERFQTIGEMAEAFHELKVALMRDLEEDDFFSDFEPFEPNHGQPSIQLGFKKSSGKGGFDRVAGMEELKTLLKREVLFALKNPEVAATYRLKVLNGMVLYGPPGCGKTFIAENFAEESGMNYTLVKASDLGNIFVHGSQSLIRSLFEKARQNAPCLVYFDEIDALLPKRNPSESNMAGEVNEFLTQLNNCSERGIFVMGSTNRPDLMDPAVLRAGRLEKLVYVPMPDKAAREALFQHELKDRPVFLSGGNEVDTAALAEMTAGFVSADICHLVNEAALDAAIAGLPIGMSDLVARVKQARRSVSDKDAMGYEALRARMEGKVQERDHCVGFGSRRYASVGSLQAGAA